MATKSSRLAALKARLKDAQDVYARSRARYTRTLVAMEARVQRLRSELAAMSAVAPLSVQKIETRGPGRPPKSRHPFPLLVRNVSAWCRENGVGLSTAKLWYRERGGRPIPLKWATRLREQYGIPFESWPNGVKDG